jgi:hypothetical protein
LDDEGIRDIADVMQTDKPLYAEGEDPSVCDGRSEKPQPRPKGTKRSDMFAHLENQQS